MRTIASFRDVARTLGGIADDPSAEERVGRTLHGTAVADLGHIARTLGGTADRAGQVLLVRRAE
jgi:hypothetical protein